MPHALDVAARIGGTRREWASVESLLYLVSVAVQIHAIRIEYRPSSVDRRAARCHLALIE